MPNYDTPLTRYVQRKLSRIGEEAFYRSVQRMKKVGVFLLLFTIGFALSTLWLYIEVGPQIDKSQEFQDKELNHGRLQTIFLHDQLKELSLRLYTYPLKQHVLGLFQMEVINDAEHNWEFMRSRFPDVVGYYYLTFVSYLATWGAPEEIGANLCFAPGIVVIMVLGFASTISFAFVRTITQEIARHGKAD